MNIDQVLKAALVTATGIPVYPLSKPVSASYPVITYRRIFDKVLWSNSGLTGLNRVRFQINVTASTYSAMRTAVAAIETLMNTNTSDWVLSTPLETQIEDKDEEAGLYISIREYYVWHS